MASSPTTSISRSVEVSAPAEQVWELVSDLPSMGRYSPENTGGSWRGSADRAAVGAVFVGRNAQGKRSWSTRSTVTQCDPGRAFAFDVKAAGLPVATWRYELTPTASGCTVTETWTDRRGRAMALAGKLTTGVDDREGFTATSIEQTLQALKAVAEGGTQQAHPHSG